MLGLLGLLVDPSQERRDIFVTNIIFSADFFQKSSVRTRQKILVNRCFVYLAYCKVNKIPIYYFKSKCPPSGNQSTDFGKLRLSLHITIFRPQASRKQNSHQKVIVFTITEIGYKVYFKTGHTLYRNYSCYLYFLASTL